MKKSTLLTTIGIMALCSCNPDYHRIQNYEVIIKETQINTTEEGSIIYYDSKPFGSLDGLGMIATGGRGMGYAGMFTSDTNKIFFQNAARIYKNTVFPIISKELDLSTPKK